MPHSDKFKTNLKYLNFWNVQKYSMYTSNMYIETKFSTQTQYIPAY